MDANVQVADIHGMVDVSIHAPVMDANSFCRFCGWTKGVSIHAPVMDAKVFVVVVVYLLVFQSTRP